jgi:outer membrane lipoprotein-sorting protein
MTNHLAVRSVLALAFVAAYAGFATDLTSPNLLASPNCAFAAEPTGEEVLDRYIEATGGKEAYEKVKSRVVSGKMSIPAQGVSGDIQIFQKAPNFTYMTISIPQLGGKIERGFDGEVGWEKNPMTGTRIVEGEEKQQLIRESTINSEINWRDNYTKVENLGTEQVDGKKTYKVKMTSKNGNEETRYYDADSGLLLKSEMTVKNAQGEFPIVATPSDWREVDGIKMPFKSTQSLTSVGLEQILQLEKIENNTDIPDDKFELPADVKELAKKNAGGTATQPK